MNYYAAPMEGVTGAMYRRAHWKFFPGAEGYYAPFLTPTQSRKLTPRDRRELLPEFNPGIPVIPQIMTKRGEDVHWCAAALADLGYREVNLNLGCPSGTVVAKGKGAGLLADLEGLERFLDEVFSCQNLPNISIKTRLGMEEAEEFSAILALYRRYPLKKLIVHPRVRREMYTGPVHLECYEAALEHSPFPVVYNGDITLAEEGRTLLARFPATAGVMVGRGLMADPALIRKLQGGPGADRDTLAAFVAEVFEQYIEGFGSRNNAMLRMKELWSYLLFLFEEGDRFRKKLTRCRDAAAYEQVVAELFQTLELRREGALPWAGTTKF